MEIKIEDLMNLTIGQVAALTNRFIEENPDSIDAQEILEEKHKEKEND